MDRKNAVERVDRFIQEHQMIEAGRKVLAGYSGGPDSTCLLLILHDLAVLRGFDVEALHVNHGLRGSEADEDEEFCRDFCSQLGIPFSAVRRDIPKEATRDALSMEMAGRKARYEELRRRKAEIGADYIVTAHHRDDSAETVLLNLFRGSGLRGLRGIVPVSGDLRRPMLCLSSEEILSVLEEEGIPYRIDSTNEDDEYRRNRIRHHILTYATQEIHPAAARNILRAAEHIAMADAYLEREADRLYQRSVEWSETPAAEPIVWQEIRQAGLPETVRNSASVLIREEEIAGADPLPVAYLLRRVLREMGLLQDVEEVHLNALLELFAKPAGKRLDLPGERQALRTKEGLRISLEPEEEEEQETLEEQEIVLNIPGVTTFPGGRIEASLEENPFRTEKVPDHVYTKWIDYDKIEHCLVLRHRREGDYLEAAPGVRKKLRRYLIDEKVPTGQRDRLLLIADGDHIVWIPGYRLSGGVRIDEDTRQVLKISAFIAGGDAPNED